MASVVHRISLRPVALLVAMSLILAACTAPATGHIGGTVRVLGAWEGAEEQAFLAVVRPFEQQTGITVEYTGSRDLTALLWEGIAKRETPDLAGLPGPGQMAEFARHGALKDLTGVVDIARYKAETVPTFVELGTVDGRLVGAFIKVSLKGLVWYNPRVYTLGAPADWDDLLAKAQTASRGQAAAWCLALESGATSGWPGTDWIEDIVLRQFGPDVYDDWVAGRLPWSSPEIRSAFDLYGTIVANAAGGGTEAIATSFMDGGNGLFSDPPECLLHRQATFMTEFFKSRAGARDGEYDFFPLPSINPAFANSVTGGGDLFGMFNDTPQARALMAYLVTPEAQSIWVRRGGALSVNTRVVDYPDDLSRRAAEVLTGAQRFRFDASDLMPEQMNAAFLQGVLDFTRDPAQLDNILVRLDEVQRRMNAGGTFLQP